MLKIWDFNFIIMAEIARNWKESNGIRVISVKRRDREYMAAYYSRRSDVFYDVVVDHYGFIKRYKIHLFRNVMVVPNRFRLFMDVLMDKLNVVFIDNMDEAERMFTEANYSVRSC